jgi:anti-sigma factor RsiW
MNAHERCLGQAQAYFSGALAPDEAAAFAAHQAQCPACAQVLGRWPHAAAVPDLRAGVLAGLGVRPTQGAPAWWAPLAAGLALALLLAAFWHPERAWLRDDRGYSDTCQLTQKGGQPCCLD